MPCILLHTGPDDRFLGGLLPPIGKQQRSDATLMTLAV